MTETIFTPREREIAELIAWGATKKEIASHLFIAEHTVVTHARSIYEKTGCRKANELSAWWFCYRFRIPMTLSPLVRKKPLRPRVIRCTTRACRFGVPQKSGPP